MPRAAKMLGLTVLLCLNALPSADAASFNCRKASTASEKAICAKATLNVLDQRMDSIYHALLTLVGQTAQRDQFRADQLHWLNVRDACGADAGCLGRVLHERIDELNGYAAAVKASQ